MKASLHLLDGQGGEKRLPLDQLSDWTSEQGSQWVQLPIDQHTMDWLVQQGLPDAAVEVLGAASTRPRFIAFESGVLLVMRGVNLNPGADRDDMIAIRIWLDKKRIITCQRRPLRSADELAASLAQGSGPRSTDEALMAIIERLSEFIETELDHADSQLEQIEDQVELEPTAVLRGGLIDLRRRTARTRRFLLPQREALERLCRQADPWLNRSQVLEVQQAIDVLTRHLEDLDLARERALLVQDELQNRIAQQQNSRVYVLSIVTAIFLPLTFLTGLLGMNVAGLPGIENPNAFLWVSGGSLVLAVGLGALFRLLRWFG